MASDHIPNTSILGIDPAALERVVELDYTNFRGERATRRVIPLEQTLRFTKTEHHTEPQWVMDVFDLDRMNKRTYAMSDIHSWKRKF